MDKVFDLIIPTINVNDEKVTIGSIRKKNLEFINEGDALYSVETSKAAEDYNAELSGYVVLYIEDGDEVEVGKSAGMIFENFEDAKARNTEVEESKAKARAGSSVKASKKAVAYAEQLGFDINLIKKDGIIKTGDIDEYIASHK